MISSRNPELLADRYWSKVDVHGPIAPGMDTPCWLWTGGKNSGGYGQFKVAGKLIGAHIVMWVESGSSLPDGHSVLHKCDVRACVRRDHLFSGTTADNMRDKVRKGRQARVGPYNPARGARNGNAKLDDAVPALIRAIYAEGKGGVTQEELAARFGVTQSQVSKIVCLRSHA